MSQLSSLLAGAALKATLVLTIAWLAAALMRRRSAASRHLVWLAAAVALIALPLLSIWTPALRITTPAAIRAGVVAFQVNVIDRGPDAAMAVPGRIVAAQSKRGTRINWSPWIAAVWMLGTGIAIFEMLIGYAALWRLRRSAKKLPGENADVRELARGAMPMTAGIWKPAVFLPREAAQWPEERRRAVLLHELAHIQRGDAAAQMIARLALAAYWWNPLEWSAWREFIKERERAADDVVLRAGIKASDYASHLVEIARAMSAPAFTGAAVAAVPSIRRSQLEGRLMAILDSKRSRAAFSRRAMWITAACAVAAIAPLAAVHAQDNPAIPADVEATIRSAQSQRDPAMLDKVAVAAEDRHNFALARKVLDAALQIRGKVSGTSSSQYGLGIMNLADLEVREHGLVASETLYAQAADLLANDPAAARVLMRLGEIAMAKKNLDQAADCFDRARLSAPSDAAMPTMWLAEVRARQGNADQADALFKSAVALADPDSINAGVILSTYASFLKKQGRADDAANYVAQANKVYTSTTVPPHHAKSATDGPFRIGDGVTAPRVISKVDPVYSGEARLAALSGTVTLSLIVGTDGMAHDIQVTRSLGLLLDDAAVDAVSQWKFAPGTRGGQPVPVIATIEVNFRLL
ncbi:MAG TPA: TonB family protein [Bryobacteraceae bacterium]|nr:TonB family protein [Bryobacteraceae bacterium]